MHASCDQTSSLWPHGPSPDQSFRAILCDSEGAVKGAGAKRQGHLSAAEEELQRIVALAAQALEAGASIAEVAELAAVSRPTLYRLLNGQR